MLNIRGMSIVKNLLMVVNRFGQGLTIDYQDCCLDIPILDTYFCVLMLILCNQVPRSFDQTDPPGMSG